MTSLAQQLSTTKVGTSNEAGGLQVFALHWAPDGQFDYLTLDEAQSAGLLEVGEVSEGGSVPQLVVHNKGDHPVFLMAGEQLAGGKQNRVLNASILIAAKANLPIPVSCVEHGRWGYRSRHFEGSGSSSHAAMRKMMHGQVTRSYRACGEAHSDQGEVWREVDRKLAETGSSSPTAFIGASYADAEPMLRATATSLPAPEGASGAVFAFGGKIVGLDLFDRPQTLTRLWAKLVRAYAIDAHYATGDKRVTPDEVSAWLAGAAAAKEESFRSAGLGDDVRLEGATLEAACLRLESHPVHVEAFAR